MKRSQMGWGPDESLTPETLEELLEGPGISADADLHIQRLMEEADDVVELPDEGSLVDNGLEFLTDWECHQLLNRMSVGRVGVSVAGVAVILPVRFAMVGDDVVFITGRGLKLSAAREHKTMTFEIDGFDRHRGTGWSVLVVGTAEEIDRSELYGRKGETLHPAAPGERDHVIRIRTDMVSGRRFGPPPGG
jgi:nitroimidazol reductase NimA-like FMN-containing flavoprotein (pyridoxamine 5'-phosphate oxidase superfamily)